MQSGFLTVPIPAANTVTTQIGVGTPFAPFSINATTPAALQIFVFGSLTTATTPAFMPVTDIDPTTVVVNGVPFPNATLTPDPNTANHLNGGIVDAIITITPRANLNLPNGNVNITISGKTLAASTLPNFTWERHSVGRRHRRQWRRRRSVVPSLPSQHPQPGRILQIVSIPTFGANQFTPSITALSALNYAPIPLSVALQQYEPNVGFRARIYTFNHPRAKLKANRGQNQDSIASGINTLSSRVFDRSRFHAQKVYSWEHQPSKIGIVTGVVPTQLKRQVFVDDRLH